MALSLVTEAPALALSATVYAYAGGTGTPSGCPVGSTPATECSLTSALSAVAPSGTVLLATPGTSTPSTHYVGNWTITESVTLEPLAGVTNPILDGNHGGSSTCQTGTCTGSVLVIGSSLAEQLVVNISGLTIEDAVATVPLAPATNPLGGAINNPFGGTLNVSGSVFNSDSAAYGGAINNADGDYISQGGGTGTLVVTGSLFESNTATSGDGGAIDNAGGLGTGSLTVRNSIFTSNEAQGTAVPEGNGGAIDNGDESGSHGALSVSGSIFSLNTAAFGGGAIDSADDGGSQTNTSVTGSTFAHNSAIDGGGIDSDDNAGSGTLTVSTSTFNNNSASSGSGGGINSVDNNFGTTASGELLVSTSTFYENSASNGGGINNGGDASLHGALTATATTFDANTASALFGGASIDNSTGNNATDSVYAAADIFDGNCANTGTWNDGGYNVGSDSSCETPVTSDVESADLSALGALGSNGGPTQTVSDAGTPAAGFIPHGTTVLAGTLCPTTDQRGGTTGSGLCDAGSFQSSLTQQTISFTAPAQVLVSTSALSATGGASSSPIVFSVDPSSEPGVCSVSGTTVTYLANGTCVVDANQAGAPGYAAANQVQQTIISGPLPQTINFTGPGTGSVGGSAALSATGGASGSSVVFTVDGSSGTGVCNVSGTNGVTVNYTALGSCVIDANQAGGTAGGLTYAAASQVQQTITVNTLLSQTISFTGPGTGLVGGSAALSATGGASGNSVLFTVDASSGAGVCNITTSPTVNYTAAGNCVIDANQAGNASYNPAPQVQQTITITVASSGGGGGGGGGGVYTPPTLTITAPSPSLFVGTTIPTLSPSYSPAPGATLTIPATCTTTATAASPVGGYPVTCSGASDPSYTIVYVPGSLTIVGPTTTPPPPSTPTAYSHSAGSRLASTPDGKGWWVLNASGSVSPYGTAKGYGGYTTGKGKQVPVAIAATPDGLGYWLVSANGTVRTFGDAKPYGSPASLHLAKPIVGITSTPDGKGYWLVASDGGVFNYGDAHFYGSTGAIHLAKPIVGLATTADGKGYWFVASDGGVFNYGDAHFYGSTGATHLAKPIVGVASTPDGKGYWLITSGGGVFNKGDAHSYGSEGGKKQAHPIVGLIASSSGTSYAIVNSAGAATTFPS